MADHSKNQDPDKQRKLLGLLSQIKARRASGRSIDAGAMLRAFPELETELQAFFKAEAEGKSTDDAFASTRLGNRQIVSSNRETRGGETRQSDTASEFNVRMFGRYRLLRPLGEGAMGSVCLAFDTTLDRQVALKMPKSSTVDEAEFLARFTREARAAARLNHSNICRVYDAGEVDGTAFITMDFIDGVPLSHLIGTPLLKPVNEVFRIAKIIAEAVTHAHENGIVHRDLKPGNILVDANRNPFVTDFGLARRLVPTEGTKVTQEGLLIGTPAYMAPEQVRGEQDKVGVACDIYSFGVVLFEMLVGRLPFDGSLADLLAKVLRDNPPIPSCVRSDLTEDIDDVVLKMLKKEPGHRYRSMADVVTAIERLEVQWTRSQASAMSSSAVDSMASANTTTTAASSHDILKAHIEVMLGKGQYTTAIQDLEKLAAETAPIAKNAAAWARNKLSGVKAEAKAMSPSALAALLQTAQELFHRHDYAGCIQLLSDVPALRRTSGMEDLLAKAQDRESEAEMLLEDIRDRERRQIVDGLEPLVRKLLKLKPGNSYARKLMLALQTYSKTPAGRRHYRFERGRLQPMPEIGFFRQWATLCILTFVLTFLGVYAYVVKVLNSDRHVIQVDIDRDWMKKQGGQLTITIDDVDHLVQLPLSDNDSFDSIITVRGERLIGVKNGDYFLYGPREFVIERKDSSTLQITATEMRLLGSSSNSSTTSVKSKANEPLKDDVRPEIETESTDIANQTADEEPSTSIPKVGDWISLFDGQKASGWSRLGPFQVRDGLLVGTDGLGHAVTENTYGDFELEAEWRLQGRLADGGIYYREKFPTDLRGNEYQIIAPSHPVISSPTHQTAAFWGVAPPTMNNARPLGEWNQTKIVCRGSIAQHWLNGKLVVRYDSSSEDWRKQIGNSVQKDKKLIPGTQNEGFILLQSFSGEIAFRSIRIRTEDASKYSRTLTNEFLAMEQPVGVQKFENDRYSLIHNATAQDVLSWSASLPTSQCPVWISLRANSHVPRFDCVSSSMGANVNRNLAIVDAEGETFEQPPLKGGLPLLIASFREGDRKRSLGLTLNHQFPWQFWGGDGGFIRAKVTEGLGIQSPFQGEEWPMIPVFLASNHVNAPGSYHVILQPHIPYRKPEIKLALTKVDLIQTLSQARSKKSRPFRFGFDQFDFIATGKPTFLVVLTENVAIESRGISEEWSYSIDLTASELSQQLANLATGNGIPRSLFSYISDNRLRYCVIWDNVSQEQLKTATIKEKK